MIDGLGRPQRILVVGASSDIAAAVVRALAARGGLDAALLTARRTTAVAELADELAAAGVVADVATWDATDDPEALVARAWADGDVDLVLVAVGALVDEDAIVDDPARLAGAFHTNLVGPATLALAAAARLRAQGHGVLVVLSSVAAVRPRASNLVYAAGKAGLDAFAQGLGDRLADDGVRVLVVRPGFVHTKMTEGLEPAPLATTPGRVAQDVVAAIAGRRSTAVWSPPAVRGLMAVLRVLPQGLYRRVSRGR